MSKTTKSKPATKKSFNPRVKIYFPDEAQYRALSALAAANKANGKPLDTISKIAVKAVMLLARRPDNVAALRKAGHSTEALFA